MRRFETVLFDLDGTLTDPFDGIAASIRHRGSGRSRDFDRVVLGSQRASSYLLELVTTY